MIETFDQYDYMSDRTAIYPGSGTGDIQALSYVTLGLVGEAGEIANKVKKVIRDSQGQVTDEVLKDLGKELGDVLWYVARLSAEVGVPLSYIAEQNVEKLLSRQERGVLGGSGDDR